MIEVEAKIKIKSPKEVRSKISKLAKYNGREKKIDTYYTLEPLSTYPKKSLRVRQKPRYYEINFKQNISYKKGVHAKNEVEFILSDISNFLLLIKEFGFKPWVKKEKITYLYQIKENFNIELNHVKKLGWFLEVEYLATKKNIKKARKEVAKMVKVLGFSDKDIVKNGYTKMLWNLKKSN